ncbi:MAG: hypothetical protein ABW101_14000 [Candidatus Thiodiazotropha sp.]
MSGFIKGLLLGDVGTWWHTHDVEKTSIEQRNLIRKSIQANAKIEEDQETRIIQLELIIGSLLAFLRDKNQIDEAEIKEMLEFAEQEAKQAVLAKKGILHSES